MKSTFLTAFIVSLALTVIGQTTFQKNYGGPGDDFGISAQQTTDGGYILFGYSDSFGSGDHDMYLVKTDDLGNELWYQTYGGPMLDFGISVQQTTDGGYILCGGYSGLGNDSLALIKTDQSGNVAWNKRYSGTVDRDVGQFVQQTSDGGFIAVGFTGPSFAEHIYMVKTDSGGNVQWTKVHQSSGREFAVGVRQTSDGGYIMVGETSSTGFGGKDMFLVKTNGNGDTTWTRTFGTSANEIGRSIYITSDGGFILLGYEDFPGGNLFLVKTDSLGNEQWHQYHGGTGWDMGHSVQQTSDGGYVLGGRKDNGTNHMYCIKTDGAGGVEWSQTYPRDVFSEAISVQQTADGGFILFGYSLDTVGGLDADMYLVKMDGMGLTSIYDQGMTGLQVLAYPNPFTECTTIELNDPSGREYSLRLLNNQGQDVRSIRPIAAGKIRVERGNLPSGIYIFQVLAEGRPVATGKLVAN